MPMCHDVLSIKQPVSIKNIRPKQQIKCQTQGHLAPIVLKVELFNRGWKPLQRNALKVGVIKQGSPSGPARDSPEGNLVFYGVDAARDGPGPFFTNALYFHQA